MREYITKLNDRNLQRKKASGITNYVLYSLIILIIIKILSLFPKVDLDIDLILLIKVFWYSFNFSLATYFIQLSFITSFNNSSSIRILKSTKNSDSYFLNILIFLMFIGPAIPAGYLAWYNFPIENYEYAKGEKLLFILNALNLIIFLGIIFRPKKEIFNIIKQTKKEKDNYLSFIILIVSGLVIYFTINLLYNLEGIESQLKFNLFLIFVLVFALLIIFEKIIESYKEDIFAKDLENLEYEIYVKDLSDEEIRINLQKKYLGFLVTDWIKFKEQEIKNEKSYFIQLESEIKNKEEALDEIDKNKYPIEFKGRKNEIEDIKIRLKARRNKYFKSNINEIEEIINKDFNLNEDEIQELKRLITLLE